MVLPQKKQPAPKSTISVFLWSIPPSRQECFRFICHSQMKDTPKAVSHDILRHGIFPRRIRLNAVTPLFFYYNFFPFNLPNLNIKNSAIWILLSKLPLCIGLAGTLLDYISNYTATFSLYLKNVVLHSHFFVLSNIDVITICFVLPYFARKSMVPVRMVCSPRAKILT